MWGSCRKCTLITQMVFKRQQCWKVLVQRMKWSSQQEAINMKVLSSEISPKSSPSDVRHWKCLVLPQPASQTARQPSSGNHFAFLIRVLGRWSLSQQALEKKQANTHWSGCQPVIKHTPFRKTHSLEPSVNPMWRFVDWRRNPENQWRTREQEKTQVRLPHGPHFKTF